MSDNRIDDRSIDFPYTVGTVRKAACFKMDGQWVWCGSCGRDEQTGLYHLFASAWPKTVPFTPNWLTHSRIVRAVSENLDGPYTWVEDLFPPRGDGFWDGCMTHNPTLHRHGDHWLLFYTGSRYAGGPATKEGPLFSQTDPLRIETRANQRIGLAVATSLEGPWERFDQPILEPRPGKWDGVMTTNPAPVVNEDGSVLLFYKSCAEDQSPTCYGLARAAHWTGPYLPVFDEPIFWNEERTPYEDATVWKENGYYHMLFKDWSDKLTGEYHGGCYATSENGVDWTLRGKGYSRTLHWDDGTTMTMGSLERPQIFLVDGKPARLFCAASDGPGGINRGDNTWTQILPLIPKGHT